jgi:hypothetical protein
MKKIRAHEREEGCFACRAFTLEEQWHALRLLYALDVTEYGPFAGTAWLGRVIEVRECTQCGRGVARVLPQQLVSRSPAR